KSGIAGVRRLPVRNAERCSTISPLIGCNASGDAEQIRKTVNAGGLYAWVEHNPNFLRGACNLHHLSLAAKTLTLAAIALRQMCAQRTTGQGHPPARSQPARQDGRRNEASWGVNNDIHYGVSNENSLAR